MSSHNICFRGDIRKILCGYPLFSVAMRSYLKLWTLTSREDCRAMDLLIPLFSVSSPDKQVMEMQ